MPRNRIVLVSRGGKLTTKQKAAIGTTAALLGLAGAAAVAHQQYTTPPVTHLDRAVAALNQARTDPEPSPYQPRLSRGEAYAQLNAKNSAMSALLAKQYGMPPARSYEEIMGLRELPTGDTSRLRPDQLRKRPSTARRV